MLLLIEVIYTPKRYSKATARAHTGLLRAHFDAMDAEDIKVKVRALGDYTSV
jgi:hypothetical protein